MGQRIVLVFLVTTIVSLGMLHWPSSPDPSAVFRHISQSVSVSVSEPPPPHHPPPGKLLAAQQL
jgi:hypothetical protein